MSGLINNFTKPFILPPKTRKEVAYIHFKFKFYEIPNDQRKYN